MQFLNIGSTEENSVRDTAFLIADLLKIDRSRIEFDVTKPAGIHRKATDNSKFTRLSGFDYTAFRAGMEKTVQWFTQNYAKQGAVRL